MLSMLALLVLGGAFVGLLSGLLGVGGAVIIMPLLNVFFDRLGFSVDTTQHLSLGTSLATILFTSLSSVLAHRRYGSVRADIWKKMAPGIIAGTLGGALLAPHLPGLFLRGFFAFFVMLVGVHLLFNSTPRPKTGRLERAMLPVSILIGLISSLAGIAGTMLCVIFLVWAAIDWADAVGTSAALSLPISLTGTLGYAIAGWNFPELPPYSVGFVYLPGMFCLLVSSMSMAVVGARLAHSPRSAISFSVFRYSAPSSSDDSGTTQETKQKLRTGIFQHPAFPKKNAASRRKNAKNPGRKTCRDVLFCWWAIGDLNTEPTD